MTLSTDDCRRLIVDAVLANPVVSVGDAGILARLSTPTDDCTFEELGFDSLARMELCIWIQMEAGIEIAEDVVMSNGSINALAASLASLPAD